MRDELSVPLVFSPVALRLGSAEATASKGQVLSFTVSCRLITSKPGFSAPWGDFLSFRLRGPRCEARFDFVIVKVYLSKVTQYIHIRNKFSGRFPSIRVEDRLLPDSAFPRNSSTFWITLPDPSRSSLEYLTHFIDRKWGLISPVSIDKIEVSVDWYPLDHSDLQRWRMVAALFRHHFPIEMPSKSARGDLRQVWADDDRKRPEFVLPERLGRSRTFSDRESHRKEVRDRILRDRSPFEHFIDATVYLGEQRGMSVPESEQNHQLEVWDRYACSGPVVAESSDKGDAHG